MIKKFRDLFKSTRVKELEHHVRVLESELVKKQEDTRARGIRRR